MAKIEAMEVPEMNQAIGAYRNITATPEFRERERLYAKARHDEAQALWNAERKATFAIAQNLLDDGDLSIEKITKVTGLTREEVEILRKDTSE